MPIIKHKPRTKTAAQQKKHIWLKHFLDESNPDTYLNATGSVRAMGLKLKNSNTEGTMGYMFRKAMRAKINKYLEKGPSSTLARRLKEIELLNAQETKIIMVEGTIDKSSLPRTGVKIIAESTESVPICGEGEKRPKIKKRKKTTILAIDTQNKEIQRKTLDMLLKRAGEYAPIGINIGKLDEDIESELAKLATGKKGQVSGETEGYE